MSYYYAERARELLREESRPGCRLPWLGDARELGEYAMWLFSLPRSRWPQDESDIGRTAACVALAARRLSGSSDALKPGAALRVALQAGTSRATEAA